MDAGCLFFSRQLIIMVVLRPAVKFNWALDDSQIANGRSANKPILVLVEKEARVAPDVGRGTGHTVMRGLFLAFNLSRMDVPVLIVVQLFRAAWRTGGA